LRPKFFPILLSLFLLSAACGKHKKSSPAPPEPLLSTLKAALSTGDYNGALKISKQINEMNPPSSGLLESLYLGAYASAYGKSDFRTARLNLDSLLKAQPTGTWSGDARKMLADCLYWQGQYEKAMVEYQTLAVGLGYADWAKAAQMRSAACLLMAGKVGDSLAAYREFYEKYPGDPLADSAQLMVANIYLKLQNPAQAKAELQKFIPAAKNPELRQAAQEAVSEMEVTKTKKK
jgi:outer membrane protein assembly factor BamD (BamD/ComL family)